MMKFKASLILFLMSTIIMTGCANNVTQVDQDDTLVINGDYVVPPAAHGNPFIGGYINGIEPYMQDNLFVYAPFPDGEFKPHLGESFSFENGILTLILKEDLKWSDGTSLTTKDVETALYMNVGRRQIWEVLEEIEVVDETTMAFHFKTNSDLAVNMLFDIKMNAPTSHYEQWANVYKEVALTGRTWHPETNSFWFSEEANEKLREINLDLEEFQPNVEEIVGSGPFKVQALTTSEALLVQNEHYREVLDIKNLQVMRVVTPENAAVAMMDGTLAIHSGGIVREVEDTIRESVEGYRAQYVSEFSQMAVVFNVDTYPANVKEFRQAIAYLINRDELMPLTEPGSLPAETTLSGLPLTLQDRWNVSDFANEQLTDYRFDPAKAEALLTAIDWEQNSEGIWTDDQGNVVSFELAVNNGWVSAMLPGEAIATRLQEFGFVVQFRPMEGSAFNDYFTNMEHTLAIEFAPTGNVLYAHPYGAYEALYRSRPFLLGLTPDEFGDIIITFEGEEINVTNLVKQLFNAEKDEVTEITEQLMKITNEGVYFIPYLEKGFPLRTLSNSLNLGFEMDEIIRDARFSGVGENLIATLIKEKVITLSQ